MQHDNSVCDAFFNKDGSRVVTASIDFTSRVWNGYTGEPITPPMKDDDWVLFAAFSPDGKRIVTASADDTARLWDAHTGKPVGRQMAHTGDVYMALFSGDGTRVLTASADHTARLWDSRTGQQISEPMLDADAVYTAAFSTDGTRVVTASADKTAQVWDILPPINSKPPSWLPDLAEAISGLSISDSSAYIPANPAKYFKLRGQLAGATGSDFWSRAGHWFFANRASRGMSPEAMK
jgi:WD40 repeat protein